MCNLRFAGLLMTAVSLHGADRPVLQLSLRRAVEIATSPEGSNRLQLATELTEQAKARSTQARAALLPSLDAAVTEQNENQNLAAFGLNLNIPIPGFQFPHIVGPYTLFDASRAPSTIEASLAQATLGATSCRPTTVPKPQSAPAMTFSGPARRA